MRLLAAELKELTAWELRHRKLLARLGILLALTLLVDLLGTAAVYFLERGAKGSDVKTIGDALFFTTVQLLTVSSQIRNPLTPGGRIVDVVLEVWGVLVVAGSAGAVATFFQTADRRQPSDGRDWD